MLALIFGPNETYFFEDGNGNRKWRAWPAFDQYMHGRVVGEIQNIAFGEDETFFINHAEGRLQYRNYMDDPKSRYKVFEDWAFHENIPHDRSTVAVNFGMNGSFFAKSSQGHRWRNVPDSFMDYYQRFTRLDLFIKRRVHTVDIGFNGAFLGVQIDNTWFWELGEEYTELSRLLGQKGVNNCKTICINPYQPQQHFVAFEDGTIHWALPAHWIQDMQSIIKLYAVQKGAHFPQSPPPGQPPDPFAQFGAQMNNALPTYGGPPTYGKPDLGYPPPPPQWSPSSPASSAPPAKEKWWRRSSSNASQQQYQQQQMPSPPPYQYAQQPVQSPGGTTVDWANMMKKTNNALDAYNNISGQGQGQGQQGQSTLDAYNNIINAAGQVQGQSFVPSADTLTNGVNTLSNGVQLVNTLTGNGAMMGQLVMQGAGAAAACCVM